MNFQEVGSFIIVFSAGILFVLIGIDSIKHKKIGLLDTSVGRIMPESLLGNGSRYEVKGSVAILLGVISTLLGSVIIIASFRMILLI